MRKLLSAVILFFILTAAAIAQTAPSNSLGIFITVQVPANVTHYKAYILIQEEETKVGYTTIGKTSIDSVKYNLRNSLKKMGVDETGLKRLGTSSRELGQYPNYLINETYEIKLKSKEAAATLLNDLHFAGLKGIVIKSDFTQEERAQLEEALYTAAIAEAKRSAQLLATKAGKTTGEIKSIDVSSNSATTNRYEADINNDYYNYNFNRFEFDLKEKIATCSMRVVFELK